MDYTVEIRPEALENLQRLHPAVARRILRKLEWLRSNFEFITPEPLTGEFKGFLKLRVGDYRVLYTCDAIQRLISVHLVGHRRDVYR